MAAPQPQSPLRPCPHCGTDNPESARFCKNCGAAVRPPPECPSCGATTSQDAKFCAMCGTALIGPRPRLVAVAPPEPASASLNERDEEPSGEMIAQLRAEAASLPAPRRPASNILSNVLMFVAFLLVMVVVIYKMNQDAPKVVSPFEGGPAPSAQPAPAAAPAAPATPTGAAIHGQIVLGEGISSGKGSLFIIVRQAGVTRGPPVAVKKIDSPTFPHQFSITSADTMIKGMPFSGPFDVQVRLDQDGNAMTKSAGDLVAATPPKNVNPGTTPVAITLDKRL